MKKLKIVICIFAILTIVSGFAQVHATNISLNSIVKDANSFFQDSIIRKWPKIFD